MCGRWPWGYGSEFSDIIIMSFKHIHKFLCIGGIMRGQEVGDGGGDGGDAVIFRLCCIKQKF